MNFFSREKVLGLRLRRRLLSPCRIAPSPLFPYPCTLSALLTHYVGFFPPKKNPVSVWAVVAFLKRLFTKQKKYLRKRPPLHLSSARVPPHTSWEGKGEKINLLTECHASHTFPARKKRNHLQKWNFAFASATRHRLWSPQLFGMQQLTKRTAHDSFDKLPIKIVKLSIGTVCQQIAIYWKPN